MEKEAEDYFGHFQAEPSKRQLFRIQIPRNLRFSFIWIIFFSIIGIFIQSLELGSFIFKEFFSNNFLSWFKSFGNFISPTYYDGASAILLSIMEKWYYFFYLGGLLALLWGILVWIINFEFVVKKPGKKAENLDEKNNAKKPEEKIIFELEKGLKLLSDGKIREAETIYEAIKRDYSLLEDKGTELYVKIKDFYDKILKTRSKFNFSNYYSSYL